MLSKYKAVNKQIVQSSLLCAPKGSIRFLIGASTLFNGLLTRPVNKAIGEKKIEEGLYAMYNNAVPILEVIVMMGIVMPQLNKIYSLFLPTRAAWLSTISTCLCLMISICLFLRVTGLRTDCCSDFNYEESLKGQGNSIRFNTPKDESKRNSLQKFLPESWKETAEGSSLIAKLLSYDWLKGKLLGSNPVGNGQQLGDGAEGDEAKERNAFAFDVLNRLITAPLFAGLLLAQLIELIPRLVIDTGCYIKTGKKAEFEDTERFFTKEVLFSFSRLLPIVPTSLENTILEGCFCGHKKGSDRKGTEMQNFSEEVVEEGDGCGSRVSPDFTVTGVSGVNSYTTESPEKKSCCHAEV